MVRQEGNRSVNRQISHSYFFPHRAERLHLSCVLLHLETNGNMNENKLPMKQLKQEDTAMEKSGTVEKMMKRVMKKMTAKGIKCKSEEAELSYLWCNHPYKARFCPNKPNGFRAEILVAMKTDTWDQISNEGKTVWVNKVNMNNSQMKFISLDNMFLCQYTTFIKKPADFLSEIEHGDDLIGATLTTAFEMLTEIKEQYAVKPLTFPIGFRINRMAG